MNIPLDEWSGSKATKELDATIRNFNEQSIKQTTTMVRLTWAIVILTVFLLFGLIVQIIIALKG